MKHFRFLIFSLITLGKTQAYDRPFIQKDNSSKNAIVPTRDQTTTKPKMIDELRPHLAQHYRDLQHERARTEQAYQEKLEKGQDVTKLLKALTKANTKINLFEKKHNLIKSAE